MKPSPKIPSRFLKEDLKHNWTWNGQGYKDQFGFIIVNSDGYSLYWKETFITKTHTLTAAKEIAIILLNDKILQ